jgi:predicted amidohydrolase YtcJ
MPAARLLFFNGDIHTVDDAYPAPDAVAVRDGLIAAAGSRVHCESALDGGFEAVDLEGKALLPGFIDTHLHPLMLVYYAMNADLHGVGSVPDLTARLRGAAESSAPGSWVVGLAFDEQDMDEPSLPTRHDLDRAVADRPVMVVKHDGHTVIVNTAAIEAAGVTADTPDPDGGLIDREPNGYPAGTFRETASEIIKGRVPLPDPQSFVDGAVGSFGKLTSRGITSAGAVMQTGAEGPGGADAALEVGLVAMLLEYIPVNLYGILLAAELEQVVSAQQTPLHNARVGAGHRIGAVKIYADGTYGSCTAYMEETYADQPDKRGFMTTSPEEIYRRMVWAHEAGLQVAVHAIGDAGIRLTVELYDRLLRENPRRDHRHRIEHASQLDARLVSDMLRLGLVVSTQPMFIHSEKGWLAKRLGPERTPWTYPFRSLVEAGVKVAGASDGPVESVDVLHAIECCVTREGFETSQCITAEQALRMYTIDAAYAQFEDAVKGSITPGKRADLVVLGENPVRVSPGEIRHIPVERTLVGGETVFIS